MLLTPLEGQDDEARSRHSDQRSKIAALLGKGTLTKIALGYWSNTNMNLTASLQLSQLHLDNVSDNSREHANVVPGTTNPGESDGDTVSSGDDFYVTHLQCLERTTQEIQGQVDACIPVLRTRTYLQKKASHRMTWVEISSTGYLRSSISCLMCFRALEASAN
jgi:hypothetical protein